MIGWVSFIVNVFHLIIIQYSIDIIMYVKVRAIKVMETILGIKLTNSFQTFLQFTKNQAFHEIIIELGL